jgi:NAD-dependent deacetylase
MLISNGDEFYPPIVILTGAGISAESGIQTFRGSGGLWEKQRVEDVATPEGYRKDPALVQGFYNARRRHLLSGEVAPNPAHLALGKLEAEYPGDVTLVTQNIDNLHERGGSRNIIHMHGELLKMFCHYCDQRFPVAADIGLDDQCEQCGRTGGLRPDIVWFGEIPYRMTEIANLLSSCGLFIAIGTSGNVYPAAGFVRTAALSGASTLELNLEPSEVNRDFHLQRYGRAGELVPVLVEELLSGNFFPDS